MRQSPIAALGLATLVAALLNCAAVAAETKPVIAKKTKSAEIEVTIEPALKAYPGLYENLLAEGQRDTAQAGSKETANADPSV